MVALRADFEINQHVRHFAFAAVNRIMAASQNRGIRSIRAFSARHVGHFDEQNTTNIPYIERKLLQNAYIYPEIVVMDS